MTEAPSAGSGPAPTEIKLHQKSRVLEISFADGKTFLLPCEFLRVYSSSAEVRGHGPGQEVLQPGKKNVAITGLKKIVKNSKILLKPRRGSVKNVLVPLRWAQGPCVIGRHAWLFFCAHPRVGCHALALPGGEGLG